MVFANTEENLRVSNLVFEVTQIKLLDDFSPLSLSNKKMRNKHMKQIVFVVFLFHIWIGCEWVHFSWLCLYYISDPEVRRLLVGHKYQTQSTWLPFFASPLFCMIEVVLPYPWSLFPVTRHMTLFMPLYYYLAPPRSDSPLLETRQWTKSLQPYWKPICVNQTKNPPLLSFVNWEGN